MKRYIVEMANDFEKKYPDKAIEIIKIRNEYLVSLITEIEAIRTLINLIER